MALELVVPWMPRLKAKNGDLIFVKYWLIRRTSLYQLEKKKLLEGAGGGVKCRRTDTVAKSIL